MKDTDLAWLAGFLDADGSIANFRSIRKESGREKYCPTVCFYNTNPEQIEKVMRILESLGVTMHFQERRHKNKKWATSFSLTTRNMRTIQIILEAVQPYLAGKKTQAELVLRFIKSRKGKSMTGVNSGYTDEERSLASRVSLKNKNGVSKSPQTIRKAQKEKI